MPDNRKYYWLKLNEDFFDDPVIDILSSLPDGEKVQLIYIKLLLKSLKGNGFIRLPGLLPTIEEELARLIRQDITITKYAVSVLEKARLLERGGGSQDLCLTKLSAMVGSETAAAARMRKMREQRSLQETKTVPGLMDGRNNVRGCYADVRKCYTEKEIEKDKEKEKEIETDPEKDEDGEKSRKDLQHQPYGVNGNVFLTKDEFESLRQQFPDHLAKIDYLSAYMAGTGKHYPDHYLTILSWAKRDEQTRPQAAEKNVFEDYSYEEGESF